MESHAKSSGTEWSSLFTDGEDVSRRLGFGTMLFGEYTSESEAFELLDRSMEHGLRLLDTAEMYPVPQGAHSQGLSERIVGSWLRSRHAGGLVSREEIILSSKVTGPSGQMPWIRGGPNKVDKRAITEAVEGSLARLDTDYLDVYHIHWPDRYVPMFGEALYDSRRRLHYSVPLEEQMEAMQTLVYQGKVRRVGLSNETPWGLMRCCELHRSEPNKYPRISCVQQAYSLLCRGFEEQGGLAECCAEEDVKLLAYSPLAMGLLTGKYLVKGEKEGLGDHGPREARLNLYRGKYSEAEQRYERTLRVQEACQYYVALARECGMSAVELAIRFVLSQGEGRGCCCIVGATSTDQLDALAAAAKKGKLPEEVLSRIETVYRKYGSPTP